MVVSQCFWLLSYVPFVPATPVQFGLAVWILIPQNEGEKVMYLILSDHFVKFESYMTIARNGIFECLLLCTLKFALLVTSYCQSRVSSEKLV